MRKIAALVLISFMLVGCQKTASTNSTTGQYNINNSADQYQAGNQKQTMPEEQNTTTPSVEGQNVTEAVIKTSMGSITVKLYGGDSPKTVANFVKLVKDGFYDGTRFHRVIKDFMIQAGDPLSKDVAMKSRWGTGGPGYTFADEINTHKLVRGSIAMANAGANTNGSQFFIVTADATSWLDGKHTNFGEVVSGMDVVSKIEGVATEGPDRPVKDIVIESISLK